MVWNDLIRGEQHVDAASLSDPVLVRADGTYLYTLPSVVDDIDLGITHVVRGEDHVANTAPQIQLFEALGAEPPAFGHHNLLVGAGGQALSKRDRSISIQGMREEGLEPLAVASYSATIGTSDTVAPHPSLHELVARFAFGKLSRAPARFDVEELRALNAKLLHALPYETVAPRLLAMGIGGGEEFWLAVRSNLAVLSDASDWWQVVSGPLQPVIADAALCGEAAALLPPEPWDASTWERWAADVKQATGIKGKALFQPLRLALTGREHGPELKLLLPLIGHARVPWRGSKAKRRNCHVSNLLATRGWRALDHARLRLCRGFERLCGSRSRLRGRSRHRLGGRGRTPRGSRSGLRGATACGWAGTAPVTSSCPGGGAAGAAACVVGAGADPFLPGLPGAGAASAFWPAASIAVGLYSFALQEQPVMYSLRYLKAAGRSE